MEVFFLFRRWKRLTAVITLVCTLAVHTANATAPAPQPGAPPARLTFAHVDALTGALKQIKDTADALVAVSDQPGGLYQWKTRLAGPRDTLVQQYPGALGELESVKQFAHTKHLPALAEQRAEGVATQTAGQVEQTLGLLARLL